MREALFPYAQVRPEQEQLLKDTVLALREGKNLIAHAPTGLGKTIATLGPALKYALDHDKKVLFLTSRQTQHLVAIETLRDIKKHFGMDMPVCDLIAKKWMCAQPGAERISSSEFTEYCRQLRADRLCSYYENTKNGLKLTPDAEQALVQITAAMPADTATTNHISKEKKVCPYEIATLLGKRAAVIIADYSAAFNEHIRTSLFKRADLTLQDCILIIDEGHNLPSRLRDMLSETLTTTMLHRALQEAKKHGLPEGKEIVERLGGILTGLSSELNAEKDEEHVLRGELLRPLGDIEQAISHLKAMGEVVREAQRQSFLGSIASFLEHWQGPDHGYVRSIRLEETARGPHLTLQYRCLDPAIASREIIRAAHRTIIMSGTLTPVEMYADLLGVSNSLCKEYHDPFSKKNRLNLIVDEVTTKFQARSPAQYKRMARILGEITDAVPGNTLVFFPSYAVQREVEKGFSHLTSRRVFLEHSGLSRDEKTQMLESFKAHQEDGAVLLAVTGGNFGEGIDLPGDLLKAVVVVGVPLTRPDLETQELVAYYEDKYGEGLNYGYIYPAITKTLQNAGRCIRSETDRGVIVYMDARYAWENYAACFPKEWNMGVTKIWKQRIAGFFRDTPQADGSAPAQS